MAQKFCFALLIFFMVGVSNASVDGLTPLHVAAGAGDTEKVKSLLESGADLFSLDSKMGVSVLHKAVYSGNSKTVEILLKHGALINLQSPSNGDTPLHDALSFKSGTDLRVIKMLISFHPNVAIKNRAGMTPIELAATLKDADSFKILNDYAFSLRTKVGKKLMASVKSFDLRGVKRALSEKEINTNESDEQGFTPLLWASREGFTEIVQLLLDRGADPNQKDRWMGANSGHKAAYWGRAGAMKLLVQHGLDVNAQGAYNGYTALHDAVARNHVDTVEVLLKANAKTNIKGHDGKTVFDIAKANNNEAILKLLNQIRNR